MCAYLQRTAAVVIIFKAGAGTEPGFCILEEISAKYHRMAEIWGGEGSQNEADSLEALGGGFNITLKTLQDQEQRKKLLLKFVSARRWRKIS